MEEFFTKVEGALDWLYDVLAKFISFIERLTQIGSDTEAAE